MRWIQLLIAGLVMTSPSMAFADKAAVADIRLSDRCNSYVMCNAQTATGDCDANSDGTGDEISLFVGSRSNLAFYADQGVGAYDCVVKSSSRNNDDSSGVGTTITTLSTLTPTTPEVKFVNLYRYLWVNCSAVGTQATVMLDVCPASQ